MGGRLVGHGFGLLGEGGAEDAAGPTSRRPPRLLGECLEWIGDA